MKPPRPLSRRLRAQLALERAALYLPTLVLGVGRSAPPTRPGAEHTRGPAIEAAIARLRSDGVAVLPRHLTETQLIAARADFDAAMRRVEAMSAHPTLRVPKPVIGHRVRPRSGHDPRQGRTYTHAPFLAGPALLRLALDADVLAITAGYLGRTVYLQSATADRYAPAPRDAPATWHHDGRGTKVNAMILLTDVGPDDQGTEYLTGTHTIAHDVASLRRNQYVAAVVARFRAEHGEVASVRFSGRAGDVILFDGNGLHRLRRTPGALRETLIVKYSAARRHVWPHHVGGHALDGLDRSARDRLDALMT